MLKVQIPGKRCDQEESCNSTTKRRLVRAATPRTEFQNMKYTSHQHMTKICHFLLKNLGITAGYPTFSVEALKTHVDMGMFMSSLMKTAIHFGPNYLVNLEVYKKKNFEEIQSLFNITQKWIMEHSEEILNVTTIDSVFSSWTRSVFTHDQVVQ